MAEHEKCTIKIPSRITKKINKNAERAIRLSVKRKDGQRINAVTASIAQQLSEKLQLKIDSSPLNSYAEIEFSGQRPAGARYALSKEGNFVRRGESGDRQLAKIDPKIFGYLGGEEKLSFLVALSEDSHQIVVDSRFIPSEQSVEPTLISISVPGEKPEYIALTGPLADLQRNSPGNNPGGVSQELKDLIQGPVANAAFVGPQPSCTCLNGQCTSCTISYEQCSTPPCKSIRTCKSVTNCNCLADANSCQTCNGSRIVSGCGANAGCCNGSCFETTFQKCCSYTATGMADRICYFNQECGCKKPSGQIFTCIEPGPFNPCATPTATPTLTPTAAPPTPTITATPRTTATPRITVTPRTTVTPVIPTVTPTVRVTVTPRVTITPAFPTVTATPVRTVTPPIPTVTVTPRTTVTPPVPTISPTARVTITALPTVSVTARATVTPVRITPIPVISPKV